MATRFQCSAFQRLGNTLIAAGLAAALSHSCCTVATAADQPTAASLLKQYVPTQKDVEYETPPANLVEKCQVTIERRPSGPGYVVLGPEGQVLRRFVDTNNDKRPDQWRYYNQGIEVYRDIDTNANNKPDQYRWVNLGGSRWGIDANEDGKIDEWKSLSAPEASREAVRALTSGDDAALQAVMFTVADAKQLGLADEVAKKLLETSTGAAQKARAIIAKAKFLQSGQTKWMRFDAVMPSGIPVDDEKATQDVLVYENAMASIDTGVPGNNQFKLLQIGEMIRVGEVWKLTQVPQPLEETGVQIAAGGVLMQPLAVSSSAPAAGQAPSAEAQKVLAELEKLDRAAPAPDAAKPALAAYNTKRIELLMKLVSISANEEERNQYLQQMIDGIATQTQQGIYPEGVARLKQLESSLKKSSPQSAMLPYLAYQRLLSEYTVDSQDVAPDKRPEVQKTWLKNLADFVEAYPKSEVAAEAMLQLATLEEFNGKLKDAEAWYSRCATEKATTPSGNRAAGAIRRLKLKGQPIALVGQGLTGNKIDLAQQYRGKVTLVVYWATWCTPCLEDLPEIRALYQQYRPEGFEVVGVCVDTSKEGVDEYLLKNKVTWPQIFEPGALESPPAAKYGVIIVPTMFLVGKDGKVENRNATVADLKASLPGLLKVK